MSFSRFFACFKKDNPAKVILLKYPTVLRFCAFPGAKLIDPTLNQLADMLKEVFNGKMVRDKIIHGLSDEGILQKDLYVFPYEMDSIYEPNHPDYAYLEFELPLESTKLEIVKLKMENIVSIRNSGYDPLYDDNKNKITGNYLLALPPQEYAVYNI